jgi:hypothetical protein
MQITPPSIGYRPLLGFVLLLVVVGITLFGFGFTAEMIALLRSDMEQMRHGDHHRRD